MSSRKLRREVGWLLGNVAIFLAAIVLALIVQAGVAIALSPDATVGEGWGGSPISQILGWVMFGAWFGVVASPVLAVVLVVYRIVVHVAGHPRVVALLAALGTSAALGAATSLADPESLAVLAVILTAYAAVMLRPGTTLGDVPPLVRGSIVGIALSYVWLIGSFVALGLAAFRLTAGERPEAAAIAVSGTALPATMLFADLFRSDVPGVNYVVTFLLVGGLAAGVTALVRAYATPRAAR